MGPQYGVPQMVLSRRGFGYWGNALPAGINSLVAGIGWFAVNSVSGALALNALTHMPEVLCLLIVVALQLAVAFLGHNLIHVFERYAFPVLVVIFLIASVWTLSKGHPGAAHKTIPGAFLIELGATFGYAVGWNPYASDYTRYFKPDTSKRAIAWWSGLGVLLSCVLLETVGAAAGTLPSVASAANPTAGWTGIFPTWLGDLTLIAIVIGGIAANALNIYSGAISFTAIGFKLPLAARRAIVALGFGADRLLRRLGGPGQRGRGLQQLPADHRLLDRPLAGGHVLRHVPAPPPGPGADRAPAVQPEVHQLGGPGRDGGRRRRLDLALLQPDRSTSAWCRATRATPAT